MTIGSGFFGQENLNLRYECERVDPEQNTTCTYTYIGAAAAQRLAAGCHQNTRADNTAYTSTLQIMTHSYPPRLDYEGGEETVTWALTCEPSSTVPEWCAEDPDNYPSSAFRSVFELPETDFATYQLIVTAGMEKLNATQGSGPTVASATPTSTGDEAAAPFTTSESTGPAEFTGAAGEMVAEGPLMVGLGAAVAAFFV
jgi:hypothetical protein